MPLPPLLQRIWELRDNVTPYDSAYVVLAEQLDAPLLTFDRRLSGASGYPLPVRTLGVIHVHDRSSGKRSSAHADGCITGLRGVSGTDH
jgi:hypothetical protein